jgi:hypothetical protein
MFLNMKLLFLCAYMAATAVGAALPAPDLEAREPGSKSAYISLPSRLLDFLFLPPRNSLSAPFALPGHKRQ